MLTIFSDSKERNLEYNLKRCVTGNNILSQMKPAIQSKYLWHLLQVVLLYDNVCSIVSLEWLKILQSWAYPSKYLFQNDIWTYLQNTGLSISRPAFTLQSFKMGGNVFIIHLVPLNMYQFASGLDVQQGLHTWLVCQLKTSHILYYVITCVLPNIQRFYWHVNTVC